MFYCLEPRRFEVYDVVQLPLNTASLRNENVKKEAEKLTAFWRSAGGSSLSVEINYKPFLAKFFRDDKEVIVLNSKQLFNYERGNIPAPEEELRPSELKPSETDDSGKSVEESAEEKQEEDEQKSESTEDPDLTADMGEERFRSFVDSKPNGPTSIGMDVMFVDAKNVYGIPEHAVRFDLPHTKGGRAEKEREPYRLYNLDVFEYELDETMALYASIPYMLARHSEGMFSGIFWVNAAETWVDVWDGDDSLKVVSLTVVFCICTFYVLSIEAKPIYID